jgi:hypothetical protein
VGGKPERSTSADFNTAHHGAFEQRFDLPRDPDAVLKEILTRREFRGNPFWDAYDRLIDRFKEALRKALRRIWRSLPELGPMDSKYDPVWIFMATILVASGITVLVLFGKKVFEFLLRRYVAPRGLPDRGREAVVGDSSTEILNRALKAADQGEFAAAIVLLFRHALVRLDETGRLSLHPGKTNREILGSIPADGPIRQGLSTMVPVFNRVRYGLASCEKSEYESFLAVCMDVTGRSGAHAA